MHGLNGFQTYGWLMLAGLLVSVFFWSRLSRRDSRLVIVYIGSLMGALLGAKVGYFVAEGWMRLGENEFWLDLAVGKTILGALLGGYFGVEVAKLTVGYKSPTGDWFALIAPLGILLGRAGCYLHGCCVGMRLDAPTFYSIEDHMGVARWPSVPAEMLFNLMALILAVWLKSRGLFRGQHFHLYLISYGVFRFFHEFVRDTPRIAGHLSGYHVLAFCVFLLGAVGWVRRSKQNLPNTLT